MIRSTTCWCGNSKLQEFSPDYLKCSICKSLVLSRMPDPKSLLVENDETDFYGRRYYEIHVIQEYGFPGLNERARKDLSERCLHWLQAILKYKQPPGSVLELGCAHGGFVAMLNWAGFDASGLELSPWLVNFAQETFNVSILVGPIEDQHIVEQSLDLVVLMDVLEHLPDPIRTLECCVRALKPDGLVVIQTPDFPEGVSYQDLLEQGSSFLQHLKPKEHLFLYSRQSIAELLNKLGLRFIEHEPAIFGHYDMFLLAGQVPLKKSESSLIGNGDKPTTPSTRLIQALIDIDDQLKEAQGKIGQLSRQLALAEADRAARLEIIERQGKELGQIPKLQSDIKLLKGQLAKVEADRAARLEIIERQGKELGQIPKLQSDIDHLKQQLAESEADRAARLEVIEKQGKELGQILRLTNEIEERLPVSWFSFLGPAERRFLKARLQEIALLCQGLKPKG